MISEATFQEMKARYGYWGSWAVWAEVADKPTSNIGDLSIFEQLDILQVLNPEVVFVGLNISRGDIESTWGNFHDKRPHGKDFKIRHALKGTKWWGGYMTDIIKDHNEVDSGKVVPYLRANPGFEKENVQFFLKELGTLGAKNPTIVAFGDAAYSVLTRNLESQFRILKIPHYSHWIGEEKYKAAVELALSTS